MTYSVELFICMILGLVIGHGIFNTGMYLHSISIIQEYQPTYFLTRSCSRRERGPLLCIPGSCR